MASILKFINFISYTDDIQDVVLDQSAEKWPFSTGEGGHPPLAKGLQLESHCKRWSGVSQGKWFRAPFDFCSCNMSILPNIFGLVFYKYCTHANRHCSCTG